MRWWMGWSVLAMLAACGSPPDVPNYEHYYEQAPFTVVVLPVRNQTADVEAPRFFMSTITQPLVDRGYYVIPVEATADMLAAEGLAEGGQLETVSPQKFREYFGADAVLYVTLEQWDTDYAVVHSSVKVAMNYRLIHTDSGEVLWENRAAQVVDSGNNIGGGGLAGLLGGMVAAAVNAASTDYVPLARAANLNGLATLPAGPYHPKFEELKARSIGKWREQEARKAREAAEGGT